MKNSEKIALNWDVIVIGGGPAGMAAALSARQSGAEKVLLLERNDTLGGILGQCIHSGFGLHHFQCELTGPEYAERFINEATTADITLLTRAMVLRLTGGQKPGAPHGVAAIHPEAGYLALTARAVVLAMGCRERTRGAIAIPGSRPAGIFTAGAAQLYMNIEGYEIGRRAVILGSGDIGLIMARRLTLEGASVEGVYELMPYSSGLGRNIVQCLHDYTIPLHLSHTITDIRGDKRVEQVVVQRVDEGLAPIPGTEREIDCDTVLLSVGLIPENELSRGAGIELDPRTGGPVLFENLETNLPGVFACGNVAHVHDLVDFVTGESLRAGAAAAACCRAGRPDVSLGIELLAGAGVGYTVPQKLRPALAADKLRLFFRVTAVWREAAVLLRQGGQTVARFGRDYMAPGEMQSVTLPAAILQRLGDGPLTLSVEAASASEGTL